MGPLASAEFVRAVTLATPAERDQDHVPLVLWSDPRVPDRTAAARDGGEDPLPALLRGLRGLEAAGCSVCAIPCNSAHLWFDAMQGATPMRLLHIVDAARDALRAMGVGGGRIGLMGTRATLASRLYPTRLPEHDVIEPSEAEMAEFVTPGIALVKANRVREAYEPFAEAASRLAARGARAVVLGCTEIPLGVAAGPPLPFPVVDTVDALARAAVAAAWGGGG